MLGGTLNDFIVSFIATFAAVFLNDRITQFSKTVFLGNFIAGFFVGIITILFYHIGFVKNLDMIIVGAVSGIARTSEAVLIAVAIAFGIGSVLFSYSLLGGI